MLDVLFVTPTERLELSYEVNGIMLLATKLLQAGYDVKQLRFFRLKQPKTGPIILPLSVI